MTTALALDEFLRPSSLEADEACPGRAQMEARACALVPALRDLCSEPARQGTMGHGVLAGLLSDAFAGNWSNAQEIIAGIEPRMAGMAYWTKDATRSALAFGLALIRDLSRRFDDIKILVERRLAGACIDIPSGGTADLIILCLRAGRVVRVVVVDWKLGWVSQGDAADHLQLGGYAGMSFAEWSPVDGVEVHLAMGRRREFTSSHYDAESIAAVRDRIRRVVAAARAPAPPLRPALKPCKYCKALLFCRAATELIMTADEERALYGFSNEERVRQADAAALAKRFAQAYDDFAKHLRAMEADAASRRASAPN